MRLAQTIGLSRVPLGMEANQLDLHIDVKLAYSNSTALKV